MQKAEIIILAGQSNAVGVGHVAYLPRHFDEQTIEKFKNGYNDVLINYFSHDIKSGGFVKTSVGCTEASKDTLGPEVGIAQTLVSKYPGRKFYIVKCAFGGTNLFHDWLSPSGKAEYDELACDDGNTSGAHYRTAGWCYNELVKILDKSIALLEKNGLSPEIKAFCWMQGESDADKEHYPQYGVLYNALLDDLAGRFGKYYNNCVFVDAGISEIWQEYEQINAIKKQYAEAVPNSFFIDTIANGLTTLNEPEPEADIAHYDSGCTVKLGNLFVEMI